MSYILNRGFGASGGQYISTAGGTLLTAAPFAGPAAPFVALGGAMLELLASFGVGSGCGQSCTMSSQYANQAGDKLSQNRDMYLALPLPRPRSAQVAALANFDTVWAWLVQQCSNPQLGDAGRRCITDRQAGACKWRDSSGNCFNWFNSMRDPIANDKNVYDDSVQASVQASVGSDLSALIPSGASVSSLILPLGILALLGLAVMS